RDRRGAPGHERHRLDLRDPGRGHQRPLRPRRAHHRGRQALARGPDLRARARDPGHRGRDRPDPPARDQAVLPVEALTAATATLDTLLQLKTVSKTFVTPDSQQFHAIRNVNLTIPDLPGRGEFRVFLGPSGCGKSTVLNIVAGLIQPTSGEALLRAKPIARPGPDRGMVFQSYSSYPWLTVLENVAFGLKL